MGKPGGFPDAVEARQRFNPSGLVAGAEKTAAMFNTAQEDRIHSAPLDDKVLTALERNPHVPRRTLRFETAEGRVTLRGVVRSYFQKQMAQEALRRVDGVCEILNELEVADAVPGTPTRPDSR